MPTLQDPLGFHIDNESQKIWRYIQLPQLLRILQEEQLHFSSPASFDDDPFEGTLPKAWDEYLEGRHRAIEEGLDQRHGAISDLSESRRQLVRSNAFVSCWHANSSESAAMWNRYNDADSTLAVTTTIDKLKAALDAQERYCIAVGEIEYVDFDASIEEIDENQMEAIQRIHSGNDDELGLILLKREEFEFEHEVRAVVVDGVARNVDLDSNTSLAGNVKPPVDVKVDLKQLIDEIRLGPNADDWFAETVRKAVDSSTANLTTDSVVESDLDTEPIK